MADKSNLRKERARGLDLLRQVYDELYVHLADEFSPADLLRAAQTLIDATDEEYSLKNYQDGQVHPGYYSFDVDMMIQVREWWILKNEHASLYADDDQFSRKGETIAKLKRYYTPRTYIP